MCDIPQLTRSKDILNVQHVDAAQPATHASTFGKCVGGEDASVQALLPLSGSDVHYQDWEVGLVVWGGS